MNKKIFLELAEDSIYAHWCDDERLVKAVQRGKKINEKKAIEYLARLQRDSIKEKLTKKVLENSDFKDIMKSGTYRDGDTIIDKKTPTGSYNRDSGEQPHRTGSYSAPPPRRK